MNFEFRFPTNRRSNFSLPCAISHFLTRANAQWEIHGFTLHYNKQWPGRVNSLIHHLFQSLPRNAHNSLNSWSCTSFLAFGPVAFTHLNFDKQPFTYITTKLRGRVIAHPGPCLIAFTAGRTAGVPRSPPTPVTIQRNWNQTTNVTLLIEMNASFESFWGVSHDKQKLV